ncbi:hypothetical protein, partial [Accumulibacter sp.]|uniref:hypothetical protein n=1 Tax=Accumulibacter sp. TaxID=2053492 RepID=UPI002C41B5AF
HHGAARTISAADSPSVNDAARASDHLFLGRDNNFFRRCNDDFFLWCDHDFPRRLRDGLTHFHCALATNASGVPDPFGAFHGNGTAGSGSHEHGSSQGYRKTLHFFLHSIGWLESNRTSFSSTLNGCWPSIGAGLRDSWERAAAHLLTRPRSTTHDKCCCRYRVRHFDVNPPTPAVID